MTEAEPREPLTRQVQAKIREALRQHGVTQEQLAERMGVSRQAVQQYLSAPCLQTATIEKLARAARVSLRIVAEPISNP